ncbi:hypothetical protein [Candidatus Binatus sp.]|uniref:hypothetical protein n=1 Tax=Candidatus Binatus sp. TaxID=2811406 RepID=UPI003CC51BA0
MPSEDKKPSVEVSSHVEPPKIYHAACGVLCDIFWWARRDPAAEDPPPPPVKDETP